ncbi:flagellin N-terminal helical domain-containing protein [Syntrophomonas erecta subsp. sporosyntropha]
MIINHNLMAMNTHRQLGINNMAGQKSIEKLSSGYRINRAGDDAAGLAISEKMRGQIRGLNQASRNAQDGISMIQTAEGNLNETHSILQRMRELATQAANDTNVGIDRNEIQKEINQLTSEINRIGNTTEFNTQKILKGGDGATTVASLGALATLPSSLGASALANHVVGTQDSLTQTTVTDTLTAITDAQAGTLTFKIGTETITLTANTTTNAGDSTVSADGKTITLGTADATTNLVNTGDKGATKVAELLNQAIQNNDALRGQYKVTATTDGSNKYTISAVAGSDADGTAGSIIKTTGTGDVGSKLTAGDVTAGTVVAGTQASSGDIALSALDPATQSLVGKGFTIGNQTIEFYDGANGAYSGNGIGVDIHGATTADHIVADIISQAGNKLDNVILKQGTATTDLVIEAKDRGTAGNDITIKDGGTAVDFRATLQIGANKGQSFTIEIKDMRANALGIAAGQGTAGFTSVNTVTNGTSNTSVEAALDVSTNTNASNAIQVIQGAIETVSAQRSQLGAYQNRLEHTINNLGTSSENLTAAESRIRDVDMAAEMMEFTKNNILQQAATAMLAQANQAPQSVLQLLR